MKFLPSAALLFALAFATGAAAAPAAKPFELHLVVACGNGAKPVAYLHQGVQDDLCLSPDVILRRADIVTAQLIQTGYGSEAARLTIADDAIERLTAATTAHTGKRFAVIYDGHVVSAPVVMEPITGNQLEIDVGSTGDSVEDFVADLAGGPAP
jgi:preprotein translocase subunit SecD